MSPPILDLSAVSLTAALALAAAPLTAQDVPVPFLVEDLVPGPGGNQPRELAEHDGFLHGTTRDTVTNEDVELFRTDGTTTGAARRLPVPTGATSVGEGVVLGNRIVYEVELPTTGDELWFSDRELTSLTMLPEINPGPGDGVDGVLEDGIHFDGRYFFFGDNDAFGEELWVTDGTAAGTELVADIRLGPANAGPRELFVHDGLLYFRARDDTSGREPWVTDGTAAGTVRLADIATGTLSSAPTGFSVLDGRVVFFARNDAGTFEMWETDGTPGGTALLFDLAPVDDVGDVEVHDGRVFLAANSPLGSELMVTDGTPGGTASIVPMLDGQPVNAPQQLTSTPLGLVFRFEGAPDVELWVSDGTLAGTQMIADVTPGGPSNPRIKGVLADGRVVFSVQENVFDRSLWITDTTETGTHQLTNLVTGGPELTQPEFVLVTDMGVFFAGTTAAEGDELWALGPVTRYGTGSAGSGGFVPRLDVTGDVTPGGAIQVDLSGGLGGAYAVVFLGFVPEELPFGLQGSATLLVDFVRLFPLGFLGGSGPGTGALTLPATIPPVATPLTVLMQPAVEDAGAPSLAGFSTGDAVQVVLP